MREKKKKGVILYIPSLLKECKSWLRIKKERIADVCFYSSVQLKVSKAYNFFFSLVFSSCSVPFVSPHSLVQRKNAKKKKKRDTDAL